MITDYDMIESKQLIQCILWRQIKILILRLYIYLELIVQMDAEQNNSITNSFYYWQFYPYICIKDCFLMAPNIEPRWSINLVLDKTIYNMGCYNNTPTNNFQEKKSMISNTGFLHNHRIGWRLQ